MLCCTINYTQVLSTSKFMKLFNYLWKNKNNIPLSTLIIYNKDYRYIVYYVLPDILEYLYDNSKENYKLFKEFYGLNDDSINDNEYSKDFKIYFRYENIIWDGRINIYTFFKDGDETINEISNFEEFINHLTTLDIKSRTYSNQLNMINSILKWKESLIKSIK